MGYANLTYNKIESTCTGYQRPSDWLDLPEILETEQKIAGLVAVFEGDKNLAIVNLRVDSGTYSIDWGDGSVIEIVASGTRAYHYYNYDDFNDTSLCSRGYRQAIMQAYPTTPTSEFTSVAYFNLAVATIGYVNQFLDVHCEGNFSQFIFKDITNSTYFGLLEQFESHSPVTSCKEMFYFCSNFKNLKALNTASCTNFNSMFRDTFGENSIIFDFDVSSATDMGVMAYTGNSIREINIGITAAGCSMAVMINDNKYIKNVICDLTNVTTMFSCRYTYNLTVLDLICSLTVPTHITPSSASSLRNLKVYRLRNMNALTTTISATYTNMPRTAILDLFGDLYDRSALSSGSISLTGTIGVADLTAADLLIATNKNWTIIY